MTNIESTYKFEIDKFDNEGFNHFDEFYFSSLIGIWEKDFHEKFKPFFANYIFANHSMMILLKKFFVLEDDEKVVCGMELINGEINFDVSIQIENHSKNETIYSLGSSIKANLDEQIYLIIDDKMPRGQAILKYIPDNDDDDEETNLPVSPINKTKKVNV